MVTGGAGFLGSYVCDRLVESGTDVVCVDNLITGDVRNVAHLEGRAGFHRMDLDVAAGLRVPGHVDLVMHLACPASPEDYQRLPLATLRSGGFGTMHALDLAAVKNARFVLASTSEVYGDPQVHPQPETYWGNVNPVGPRSCYDEAKRYAEALTVAHRGASGLRTGIARIFNTYGPRMRGKDGRLVPTLIGQALRGVPLTVHGDGSQTRSLCYVNDTVSGLLALAASDAAGPINIGNPRELPVRWIAEEIAALAGGATSIEHTARITDDPQRRCPDIGRARDELGWSPRVSLRDGLAATIDWYRAATSVRPAG